jgi:hypothetical protein
MSFEDRFTAEERFLLATTPSLIGSAMAFAESSGLATVKELLASATSYIGAVKQYPDNEIIRGVVPNLEDRKGAMARAEDLRKKATDRLKQKGVDSPEKIRALLLEDARSIAGLLQAKASPAEAAQYKKWAMAVAEKVAKAGREGGFLGFGGEQVSEKERTLFSDLAEALGADARLV